MTGKRGTDHYLDHGTLLGRTTELQSLVDFLDILNERDTSIFANVIGDPGIGKSAILDAFAGMARARGATVLTGRAFRGAADRPLGVFSDMLEDRHDIPSISGDLPEHTHRNVRGLLERLAAERPLVLVLDDCHAYDSRSLTLLGDLLRKPPDAPVMFVLGYRDRQACTGLRSGIQDRLRAAPAMHLEVRQLSEQTVYQLLGEAGTPSWRKQLHQDSGGNPRYLHALLRERSSPDEPARGPGTNHDDIDFLGEFDGITGLPRHVADAAAVLGDGFDIALIATMLAEPEQTVLAALDSLIARDLVRPAAHGTSFAFRHAVIRRAIYRSLGLSRRIGLHERAEEALRERAATALQRAPHVQHSIRHGDLEGADLLTGAAVQIMANQPDTATSWLRTALQTVPQQDETRDRRAVVLTALARSLGISGKLPESLSTMHHALRAIGDGRPDQRAEAVAHIAAVERMLGTHSSTDAVLRAEIAARGDDTTVSTAFLQLEMAHRELVRDDPAASHQWAGKALAISRLHGHHALEASCLGLLSKTDCAMGNVSGASTRLDVAAAILDGMLDDKLPESLDAAVWIGWSEVLLRRWRDAARHFGRAVDSAVRTNNGLVLPHLLLGQVMALRNRGRLVDAQAAAQHALRLAEQSTSQEQLFVARAMLSWANSHLGSPDKELDAAAEAMARGGDAVVGWQGSLAVRMLAEARLMNDDPDGCLELVHLAGGANLQGANATSRATWYELAVRAELDAGRPGAAARWAERSEALSKRVGSSGLGHLATAQVLLATDPSTALPRAQQAVAGIRPTGAIIDELRARIVLGIAMWHRDCPDEALRELRSAKVGLERIGAVPLAKRARREQRRLAARGPRLREQSERTATETVLTRREQQIAELVRDGLTNRRISRTLSISEKTVEMHLTNLFAKLGVVNRAGVAAYVTNSQLAAMAASAG